MCNVHGSKRHIHSLEASDKNRADMLGMRTRLHSSRCGQHLQSKHCSDPEALGRHLPRALLSTSTRQGSRTVPSPRSHCAFKHTLQPARSASALFPPPLWGVDSAVSAMAQTWSGLPVATQSCLILLSHTMLALCAADLTVKYVIYAAKRAKRVCFSTVRA